MEDLLNFAKANNIKNAKEVIEQVTDVVANWPVIAKECNVPTTMIDKILPNMCTHLE